MKRKYKQGDRVDSVAELLEHDWFIVHCGHRTTKTMHKAVRLLGAELGTARVLVFNLSNT
ncbi:MAG: hypothetical protein ACLUGP_07435 [Faecalibacterium prausnitzii]